MVSFRPFITTALLLSTILSAVQGGKFPGLALKGDVKRCTPVSRNHLPITKNGPIELPYSQGGDLTTTGVRWYNTFKVVNPVGYRGMSFTMTYTDMRTTKDRTYDLSINYNTAEAKDKKFYFSLLSQDEGGSFSTVQLFYLSNQDSCSLDLKNDDQIPIDKVEMFEY